MTWAERLDKTTSDDLTHDYDMQLESGSWFCCAVGEKLQLAEPLAGETSALGQGYLEGAIRTSDSSVYALGKKFPELISKGDVDGAKAVESAIKSLLTPELVDLIRSKYIQNMRFARKQLRAKQDEMKRLTVEAFNKKMEKFNHD